MTVVMKNKRKSPEIINNNTIGGRERERERESKIGQ
jgi:hypothetical protein